MANLQLLVVQLSTLQDVASDFSSGHFKSFIGLRDVINGFLMSVAIYNNSIANSFTCGLAMLIPISTGS